MQELDSAQEAMAVCSTAADAPLIAYVSKMVAVPASALPRVPGAQPEFLVRVLRFFGVRV